MINKLFKLTGGDLEAVINLYTGKKKYINHLNNNSIIRFKHRRYILFKYISTFKFLNINQLILLKHILYYGFIYNLDYGYDNNTHRFKLYLGIAHLKYSEQLEIIEFINNNFNVNLSLKKHNIDKIRVIGIDFFKKEKKIAFKLYYILDPKVYSFLPLYNNYIRHIMIMFDTSGRLKYSFRFKNLLKHDEFFNILTFLDKKSFLDNNFYISEFAFNSILDNNFDIYGIIK